MGAQDPRHITPETLLVVHVFLADQRLLPSSLAVVVAMVLWVQ